MEPAKPLAADTYAQARAAMVRKDFFATTKWKDQRLRADRSGAQVDIILFETRLVSRLKSVGIPFFAHCVQRSELEQARLYDDGFSNAKAGQSPHQYGCAVDLIHSTMGWDLPGGEGRDSKSWQLIGEVGKEVAQIAGVDIEWGGDWPTFWDPAHWQLRNWREIAFP